MALDLSILDRRNESSLAQLIRYGLVGGVALAADVTCLVLLTELAAIHYLWSAAFAFSVGLTVNYTLSVRWVFSRHRLENRSLEFVIFGLIGVVGLAINEVTMWALTEHARFPYLLSKGASTGVVFLWNFYCRKLALFSSAGPLRQPAPVQSERYLE